MFVDDVRGVLSDVSEYTGEIVDISVYTDSTTTRAGDDEYEISGRFPDEKDEDELQPPRDSIVVSKESEVGRVIREVFEEVRSGVTLNSGRVTSIHFSECREPSAEGEWPFYTSEDADYRFFIGVTDETPPDSVIDSALDVAVDSFGAIDDTVTRSQIIDMEFLFADLAVCDLSSVRGHIETAYPERHLNIDSFDEYVEKRAESEDGVTEESLRSKGLHQIWAALPVNDNHKPSSEVCEVMEELMWEYVMDSVETEWEFQVECEAIQVRGGNYVVDGDMIKYYLYIPVVGDDIGRNR